MDNKLIDPRLIMHMKQILLTLSISIEHLGHTIRPQNAQCVVPKLERHIEHVDDAQSVHIPRL